MSAKVKKFLKWFLIIILVVASVGATVFIFFKEYNKKKVEEVNLIEVIDSQEEFNDSFDEVFQIITNAGKQDWFSDVEDTKICLDTVMSKLTNYYIKNNFKVKEKNISDSYSSMQTTRNLLMDMFDEYIDKSTSSYFPRLIGANDIYVAYANYLTKYAKFVSAVNKNIMDREDLVVASDLKFSIVDLYARIIMNSFSKVVVENDLKVIESDDNIDAINDDISFEYSLIESDDNLSINAIKFVQTYNKCDKTKLAKNFTSILTTASIDAGSTNEQKAAFYFKEIF